MPSELHPFNVEYLTNPSQASLRELALLNTPYVERTAVGSLNKISRNKSRVAKYTYVITREPERFSGQSIDPDVAAVHIERQRAYIEQQGRAIELQGYLGVGARAVPVQWLYTMEAANIAGMQQILAFDAQTARRSEPFRPAFRVVYTPGLEAQGLPGGQAILVDLDNYTTYILGPDYFGESKKGALRMLNAWVYREGGLVLHAGAKAVTVGGRTVAMTVMGLSGTGKTTTTFSRQGDVTQPIQDDMVCLWPGGEVSITENGCFAKTFGLTEESEPVIYRGTVSADAWVENAWLDPDGTFDFAKVELSPAEVARMRHVLVGTGANPENVEAYASGQVSLADVVDDRGVPKDGWDFVKWNENGRSIVPMSAVPDAANLHDIPAVEYMGILNRDEGRDAAIPGIVRFPNPEQGAGFFMLGETTKTSAAGKETGKTRSPFTQPFFPLLHGLQARRFSELAATMPHVTLWLMNTGYVGGDGRSVKEGVGLKVKIRHSSAMLEALLTNSIVWKRDPDFGYEIVDVDHPANAALVAAVPADILNPVRYYEAQGRMAEYRDWVERMKRDRAEFLRRFGVDEAIVAATCA